MKTPTEQRQILAEAHKLRLEQAATTYDRKQAGKRGYNPYALGQYLAAIERMTADFLAGDDLITAVSKHSLDRFRDFLIRNACPGTPLAYADRLGYTTHTQCWPEYQVKQGHYDAQGCRVYGPELDRIRVGAELLKLRGQKCAHCGKDLT